MFIRGVLLGNLLFILMETRSALSTSTAARGQVGPGPSLNFPDSSVL